MALGIKKREHKRNLSQSHQIYIILDDIYPTKLKENLDRSQYPLMKVTSHVRRQFAPIKITN